MTDAPEAAAPVADFASIQVIFDHLQNKEGGHFLSKFVLTTEDPDTALSSLVKYYDMPFILAAPGGMAVVKQAAMVQDFAYIYTNPENIQVIMALESWALLCSQYPDNNQLSAVLELNRMVAERMAQSISQYGSPAALQVVQFSFEDAPKPPVEDAQQEA
jgi:hypothetical protein